MTMLDWRTLVGERNLAYTVNGTELETTACGEHGRFRIYSVRNGYHAMTYHVRDAHTVSDADVKAGVRPAVTFKNDNLDLCVKFCLDQQRDHR